MCLKIDILKYIVSRRAKLGQIQGGGGGCRGPAKFRQRGGGGVAIMVYFYALKISLFYAKRLKRAHI